jgi:hypothetical protein
MTTRLLWFVVGFLFSVPVDLDAQGVAIIEIENVQLARSLAAVVHDPAGFPMASVLVEELSSDWKESLRSTKTDATGAFTFAPVKGRDIYYFQLTLKGFNPLRLRVKLDRKRGKELQLQMEFST